MAEVRVENDQVPGRVKEQLCLPCTRKDKKTVATVFCYDCDNFQCEQCVDVHNIFDIMKDHKIAKADEITMQPVPFDMKDLDRCETHGKLVEFLCKDDDKLCCSTCAIVNHRACHSVVEIQSDAVVSEDTGMEIRSQLVCVKDLCDSVVMHWKSTEVSLRGSVRGLPEKINRIRDSTNKKFDDLLQDIEKDSTAFLKLQLAKEKDKISKCDGFAKRFQTSLKFLDGVRLHGTAVQKFIAEHEIKEQVKIAQKEVEHECNQLETADISFTLNETATIKGLIEGNDRIGALKTETNKVTIDHVRGHIPVNLELINSIDLCKSEDDEKEPLLAGIDFLRDGRLVATDNKNDKVLVSNDCLEKTGSYKLSYHPLSVVAVSEDTIAITSATGGNTKIEFLHVSKSNEITYLKTCKASGKYNSICLKDDDNFVVGTFEDTLVRIVSLSGEEKDLNVTFPSKTYNLTHISCTYIKERDKVVISDGDDNLVYIYDVTTNTRVIVRDNKIQKPRGVAVGPMNCIFVCCANTDSIVHISPTGEILSSHKLDIAYPCRVCVSKDKTKLAVTNAAKGKMRSLQVFKINY